WVSFALIAAGVAWHFVESGAASFPSVVRTLFEHRFVAEPVVAAVCIALLLAAAPSSRRGSPRKRRETHLRDGAQVDGVRAEREVLGDDEGVEKPKAHLVQAWWRSGRLPPEQGDPVLRALAILPLNIHWQAAWRWQWRRWLFV